MLGEPTRSILRWVALASVMAGLGPGCRDEAPDPDPAPPAVDWGGGDAERGRAIYRGTAEVDVIAQLGEGGTEVPLRVMPCVNCHGKDGHAPPEGGAAPADLRFSSLLKPYVVDTIQGRRRPPYTLPLLARAIRTGIDAGDNHLHVAMPHYRIADAELRDLLAYLSVVGTDTKPGVTESEVRIGLLRPRSGPMHEIGRQTELSLRALFAELDAQGGIYRRTVQLQPIELPDPLPPDLELETIVPHEELLALLAPTMAGIEQPLLELAREHGLLIIGPHTLRPRQRFPIDREVFYLLGGVIEQARALLRHAGCEGLERVWAIVPAQDDPLLRTALDQEVTARPELQLEVREAVESWTAEQQAAELRAADAQAVLWLGDCEGLMRLLRAADAKDVSPRVLVPSPLACDAIFDAPPRFVPERLYVALPTAPVDVDQDGLREYSLLSRAHGLDPRFRTVHFQALAAGKLLALAMQEVGRELDRDGIVAYLETLRELRTGLVPPLSYGPNQRIGAHGAYLVRVDPEQRGFDLVVRPDDAPDDPDQCVRGGWVELP